jgi:hypothetical protein
MPKDATKVRVALTGTIYAATEGSTIPADISVTPDGSFVDLGYTTAEGVTFSVEQTTEDVDAWQSLDPLRVLVTAEPKAFNFTLRQVEKNTWLTAFGGSVVTVGANNFRWEPPAAGSIPAKAYVIEFDDEALKYRFIYRRVNQTGARELNFVRGNAVNLPLAYRVLAASPRTWEVQTNDPAFA